MAVHAFRELIEFVRKITHRPLSLLHNPTALAPVRQLQEPYLQTRACRQLISGHTPRPSEAHSQKMPSPSA